MHTNEFTSLSADDILGSAPGSLFGGTPEVIRKAFHKLAALWHPDICADPRAGEVMRQLIRQRDHVTNGKSPRPAARPGRILRRKGGGETAISPLASRKVDFGEILVGSKTLTTLWSSDLADLALNEATTIAGFKFADTRMKTQMAASLPRYLKSLALAGGEHAVILERNPGEILLADLIASQGPVPLVHAAWICSGLMNIAAWLSWSGIGHGAIGPETILIDPGAHGVRLALGWGFATPFGKRPEALPGRTLSVLPRLALPGISIDARVDPELIRQTVRECLGLRGGATGSLPVPIANWLTFPPDASGFEDYAAWQKALVDGLGKRRFVEFPVTEAMVYK